MQLERSLQILFELMRTGSGLSLEELAASYGTSTRTIQRDLNALRAAGLPIESEPRDKRKHWRLENKAQTHRLSELLTTGHFLAICLAMGAGGALRANARVFTLLEDLQDKIQKAIGARGRKQLEAIFDAFYSYEKHAYTQAAPDILQSLVTAIESRTICVVSYRRPQPGAQVKGFEILPLKIFAHQGSAYLMCQVIKHEAIGTLNLQRVRSLKHTDRQGTVPADFDPAKLEQSAFGVHTGSTPTRYTLQFDAEVADYIRERSWHPSQRLTELPEGRVELCFTCGESWEVSAWVASWRHWVQVLEPEALRQELRELGETLASHYAAARA